MKNIQPIDRFARLLLGIVLLEAAFFWLQGYARIAAYGLAGVLLATALLRFCPMYRVLGLGRPVADGAGVGVGVGAGRGGVLAALVLLAVLLGGSYASAFFSKKLFLQEFSVVNQHYKLALFLTGKGERAPAVAQYAQLLPAYRQFQDKYSSYQPFALRGDSQFVADLQRVDGLIQAVNALVQGGDLHQAHLGLEKVRPVFQDLFKRNGFSMLAVALVDFHDAMELILDAANAKDAAKTLALYPAISAKLQPVESEAPDAEIQAIRKNLDGLQALAQQGQVEQLPAQAQALKSSFIKVYLQRG